MNFESYIGLLEGVYCFKIIIPWWIGKFCESLINDDVDEFGIFGELDMCWISDGQAVSINFNPILGRIEKWNAPNKPMMLFYYNLKVLLKVMWGFQYPRKREINMYNLPIRAVIVRSSDLRYLIFFGFFDEVVEGFVVVLITLIISLKKFIRNEFFIRRWPAFKIVCLKPPKSKFQKSQIDIRDH